MTIWDAETPRIQRAVRELRRKILLGGDVEVVDAINQIFKICFPLFPTLTSREVRVTRATVVINMKDKKSRMRLTITAPRAELARSMTKALKLAIRAITAGELNV